jgi:hypothetical protein
VIALPCEMMSCSEAVASTSASLRSVIGGPAQ